MQQVGGGDAPARVLASCIQSSDLTLLAHLLGDPGFEVLPVDGGELAEVGSEPFGVADVDVLDLVLRRVGVPMHENTDAARERTRDRHFVTAKERYVEPAELPCGKCREFGIEIGRGGEDRAGDVTAIDIIAADHEGDELARRGENFLTRVLGDGGRASHSAAIGHDRLADCLQGGTEKITARLPAGRHQYLEYANRT